MVKNSLSNQDISEIENITGYVFKNKNLIERAFTHSSAVNGVNDYERLEFLGDSVLQLAVTDFLLNNYKKLDEGQLTRGRAKIVSKEPTCKIFENLDLARFVIASSSFSDDGRENLSDKMKSDILEALIGAIYRDGGMKAAFKFIIDKFSDIIDSVMKGSLIDSKSELYEYCAKAKLDIKFKTQNNGSANNPMFSCVSFVDGKEISVGNGKSKRAAEQDSAKKALELLKKNYDKR